MRFLRFLTSLFAILLLVGAIGTAYYYWHPGVTSPCATTLTYKIGTFDSRFGISQADFVKDMKEAASVWNKAAGKPILAYGTEGTLPVNLVYDSREATTQKNQSLQTTISSGKAVANSVKTRYAGLKAQYNADQNDYETALGAYNQNLDAYNQEVSYWNQQGGAPKSEFEKLNSEKAALDTQRRALEAKRTKLNAEAQDINSLIDQYNLVVDHVNANVSQVNQSAGREFEEGEYISDSSGKRINIYEFQDHSKLVRVLAHELGHALGLDHNGNPLSIMYYLNQSSNIMPSADDIAALKTICKLN